MTSASTPGDPRVPWLSALVVGLVAFVVVFGLVGVLFEVDRELSDERFVIDEIGDDEFAIDVGPGTLTEWSWAVFGAHVITVDVTVDAWFGSFTTSMDVLEQGVSTVPLFFFHFVPVATLLGAGYGLVRSRAAAVTSKTGGAMLGAAITIGYLPAVVASIVYFRWEAGIDEIHVVYEIPLVEGVLVAGLLFPLIFGGIGGYLGASEQ